MRAQRTANKPRYKLCILGDLECISGCLHRPLSGRVVTCCDWLTWFLAGRGAVHASVVHLGEPATGVYDARFGA